jgi:hypothetical protein
MIINGSLMFLPYHEILNGLYLGLVNGIIIAVIQKAALYLHFGRFFKGWMRATILGWVLGGIGLISINWNINLPSQWILMFQAIVMTMPPMLAQALILQRSIRQAWLWPFLAIVGAIVFAGTMWLFSFNNTSVYSAFAVNAAVTGLTLLWLYGTQANELKFKNDASVRHLEDRAEAESADSVELEETVQRKVV